MSTEKRRSTKAIIDKNGRRVTPVTHLPASGRVEALPCTACKSTNTFIYATRQYLRYVKCRRCGHSFSMAPPPRPPVPLDDLETR